MKILIADDSKVVRHTIVGILKQLGYIDIVACADVKEAREALSKGAVDLILSDWHMPGETGLDFLKAVRAIPVLSKTPFIMITTETERSNVLEALKCGVQNYIFKPIQKDVLAEKIRALAATYGFMPPSDGKAPVAVAPSAPQPVATATPEEVASATDPAKAA